MCASFVLAVACKGDAKGGDPKIAALADLTTRQLIAGLNAKNTTVLAGLIVLTSTAGGAPRPLTPNEMQKLVYPNGPFEYDSAGQPGTIVLRDGAKTKRVVRLVRAGEGFKVLASSESLGAAINGIDPPRVLSIMK